MTFLLPRSLLNSSTDSKSRTISRNDTIHSMGVSNETDDSYTPGVDIGPWGKKLPATNQFEDDPLRTEPRFRIASEGCYDKRPKTSTKTQIIQSLSAPVLNKAATNGFQGFSSPCLPFISHFVGVLEPNIIQGLPFRLVCIGADFSWSCRCWSGVLDFSKC